MVINRVPGNEWINDTKNLPPTLSAVFQQNFECSTWWNSECKITILSLIYCTFDKLKTHFTSIRKGFKYLFNVPTLSNRRLLLCLLKHEKRKSTVNRCAVVDSSWKTQNESDSIYKFERWEIQLHRMSIREKKPFHFYWAFTNEFRQFKLASWRNQKLLLSWNFPNLFFFLSYNHYVL